jgi:hypothetical protein
MKIRPTLSMTVFVVDGQRESSTVARCRSLLRMHKLKVLMAWLALLRLEPVANIPLPSTRH